MGIKRMDVSFTSASDGSFTQSVVLNGFIVRVVTNPGSAAPDANWDLTLVDDAGLDLFLSQGLNRHTTNSEHFCPGLEITDGTTSTVLPVSVNGTATLTIANAGSAKTGQVSIFTRD